MNTYRIVIRVTTTEDFEFKVQANTREEARGKALKRHGNLYADNSPIRRVSEERFVSLKAVKADENSLDK